MAVLSTSFLQTVKLSNHEALVAPSEQVLTLVLCPCLLLQSIMLSQQRLHYVDLVRPAQDNLSYYFDHALCGYHHYQL